MNLGNSQFVYRFYSPSVKSLPKKHFGQGFFISF